jgi:dienelactone hydrolase
MPSTTRLVFDPPTAGTAIDFGDVPFPDDLYLGESGIQMGALPGESESVARELYASVRRGLTEIDGFGANSAIFFRVEGAIDEATLPATPSASLAANAAVFLVDVDAASPTAMQRMPVAVEYSASRGYLTLRPADGSPLEPGRSYAAVVTRRVLGTDGRALSPASAFATVRDATAQPTDPTLARAWMEYRSVLAGLSAGGVAASDVVGLAHFRVQTITEDMTDVRMQIRARSTPALRIERVLARGAELDALLGTPTTPGPGGDAPGGVAHDNIGYVVDGTFEAPNFLSATPHAHDTWQHSADGHVMVRSTSTVWFTLVLPRGDLTNVPTVIYQHGLGNDRSQIFAIADTLAQAGYAVAAIDIPYHGMRAAPMAVDTAHTFGSTMGPDLYGDITGTQIYVDYLGVFEPGPYAAFHPFYPRDAFRQSVSDLFALTDTLERADWSVVTTAAGGPATLDLDTTSFSFVGISLGGILGTIFTTMEPKVGAAVLNVTGGQLTRLVDYSASFRSTFFPILFPQFSLDLTELDATNETISTLPMIALYQTLMDRGDSMSFTPRLARTDTDVLFQMAVDDETVPNLATESLAHASGATIVAFDARFTSLERVSLPVGATYDVGGGSRVVRTMTTFAPASHGLLVSRNGSASVEHPPVPPFVELAAPTPISNPITAAQSQVVRFFDSWRAGTPEVR